MDGWALLGSATIHIASAMLAALPAPLPPEQGGQVATVGGGAWPSWGGGWGIVGSGLATRAPQLFVVSSHRPSAGLVPLTTGRDCPTSEAVYRDATPDFALFGREAPFGWVAPTSGNAMLCALIGADGRVVAAFVATSSGDPLLDEALLATLRGLPFDAAERHGMPASAWHRLILNRAGRPG